LALLVAGSYPVKNKRSKLKFVALYFFIAIERSIRKIVMIQIHAWVTVVLNRQHLALRLQRLKKSSSRFLGSHSWRLLHLYIYPPANDTSYINSIVFNPLLHCFIFITFSNFSQLLCIRALFLWNSNLLYSESSSSMEGKTKDKVDFDLGCGLVGKIFHLKNNNRPRKSSVHSLPMKASNTAQQREQAKNDFKPPLNHEPKVPRESAIGINPTLKGEQNPARKSSPSHRAPSAYRNTPNERPSDAARTSIQQTHDPDDESKQQKENSGNSLELARISTGASHHQNNETKSPAKEFVLPITGNLLVNSSPRTSVTKSKESNCMSGSSAYSSMGNIMRKNSNELAQFRSPRNGRADPEVMKSMGNEAYKLGRFEEALVLYDRAIDLDSNKATYHCNKSAALIGLGRFLQAIVECEEAIRLKPSYGRAHNRLATIYFRYSKTK